MLFHRRDMGRHTAPRQNAAMHQRVQGFDPPIHDLGEAGVIADLADINSGIGQRPGGAAGGQDFHPLRGQECAEFGQACLVGYGNQGAGNRAGFDVRHFLAYSA